VRGEKYSCCSDRRLFMLFFHKDSRVQSLIQGIRRLAQTELREETDFRAGRIEKLLDLYSHPGYIGHKVRLLVACDLGCDPLEMDDGEEIRIHTFTLDEALAATKIDYRCDSEAALALWLYARRRSSVWWIMGHSAFQRFELECFCIKRTHSEKV
jgi:hypothetical protein